MLALGAPLSWHLSYSAETPIWFTALVAASTSDSIRNVVSTSSLVDRLTALTYTPIASTWKVTSIGEPFLVLGD